LEESTEILSLDGFSVQSMERHIWCTVNEVILDIVKKWRESDSPARHDLIRDIVKTGSPDGLKLLSQVVNRDKDIEIRQSARKAYNTLYRYCYPAHEEEEEAAKVQSGAGDEQILNLLQSQDPDQEMKALQEMRSELHPRSFQYVRQYATSFHDDRVKATLVKTIAQQRKAEDVPVVYNFLEDESPRVRANAIEALEMIDHPNTYMIFIQWLSDSDNRVKANCIKALRKLGQQSVNRILEDMLHSEYTAYKESALYVISLNPSKQGFYLIQGFLAEEYDPSLVERAWHVVHDFAQAGVPGAQDYIDQYYSQAYGDDFEESYYADFDGSDLDSDDPEVVLRALSRILENDYREYASAMIDLLQRFQGDSRIESYVVRIFGELTLSDYMSQILPFLNSEDDRVRANAVEAIGLMGDHADSLVPFLQDRNNRVRANAIVALSSKYDVSESVADMAAHEDPLFRRSVLYAIKKIKNPLVLNSLENLIHDQEVSIRNQALEVLQFYEICGIEGATDILQSQGQSLYA